MRRSGVRIPLPPVFARSGAAERRLSRRSLSEGGHFLTSPRQRSELRLGKPDAETLQLRLYPAERDRPRTILRRLGSRSRDRLRRHNAGQILHTNKWKPWRIKTHVALSDSRRAVALERYLKSSSGRAFYKEAPLGIPLPPNSCLANFGN
jgi:hypothetical protein